MIKKEFLKESAKTIKAISDETLKSLKQLKESSDSLVIDFENMSHYEQFGILVKEGFVEKDYRNYSITDKGIDLIESVELYNKDINKFEKIVEADYSKMLTITYKKHDEENNIICNEEASFEVEKDGLPVIIVNEESYAGLLHRTKGQHWVQYLGESGRNLVRQKKLSRFYVEDESTSRRYLYLVPKK